MKVNIRRNDVRNRRRAMLGHELEDRATSVARGVLQ